VLSTAVCIGNIKKRRGERLKGRRGAEIIENVEEKTDNKRMDKEWDNRDED
jgi:hypothetical protein